MKLSKAQGYLDILNGLFDRKDLSIDIIFDLSDILEFVEKAIINYNSIKGKILNDYYLYNNEENCYIIIDKDNITIASKSLQDLENKDIAFDKKLYNTIENISAREYSCLKDFFYDNE